MNYVHLQPGWLDRQITATRREVKSWPSFSPGGQQLATEDWLRSIGGKQQDLDSPVEFPNGVSFLCGYTNGGMSIEVNWPVGRVFTKNEVMVLLAILGPREHDRP